MGWIYACFIHRPLDSNNNYQQMITHKALGQRMSAFMLLRVIEEND